MLEPFDKIADLSASGILVYVESFASYANEVIKGSAVLDRLPQCSAAAVEAIIEKGLEVQEHASSIIKRCENGG